MWPLIRSLIAHWACRSLARFFANWSGVRLATPRADRLLSLRFRPAVVVVVFLPLPSSGPSGPGVSVSVEFSRDGAAECSAFNGPVLEIVVGAVGAVGAARVAVVLFEGFLIIMDDEDSMGGGEAGATSLSTGCTKKAMTSLRAIGPSNS